MGVKGLWTIVEPSSENINNLERLRGHRLAIDASIWLYQLTKALPADEKLSKNAHLGYNPLVMTGLVRRICKLLHFGIKPVFVFDGGVPILKANTIKDRQGRRAEAETRYKRLAKKVLKIRMGLAALGVEDESAPIPSEKQVIETDQDFVISSSSESELEDFDYDQLKTIDVEAAEFKSLPLEMRQELLLLMKERLFAEQLGKTNASLGTTEALDFSKGQIEALVKRRKIAGELEKVSRSSYGSYSGQDKTHRIAASSTKEFVLVKTESGGWTFTENKKADEDPVDDSSVKVNHAEEDDEFERRFFENDTSVVATVQPELNIAQREYVQEIEQVELSKDEKFETAIVEPSNPQNSDSVGETIGEVEEALEEIEEELPSLEDLKQLKKFEHVLESNYTFVNEVVTPAPSEEVIKVEHYIDSKSEDEWDFLEEYKHVDEKEIAKRLEESLREAQDKVKAAQNESARPDDELQSDFIQLLNHWGLPWLIAPMEAEAQCAHLQRLGLVDGIITDDSDVLVFGTAPLLVYRHFFKDRKPVQVFSLARIELQLGLGQWHLILLAFLLGGDYGLGIRGIGAKRGLELAKLVCKAESLKALSDEKEKIIKGLRMIKGWVADIDTLGADFTVDDQKAIEKIITKIHHIEETFPNPAIVDAYMNPSVSDDSRPFSWLTPDPMALERFLQERTQWTKQQFRTILGPILRKSLK